MNSDGINYFARTNFRNRESVFGIKEDDRRRHLYAIGKTGMGKTNLIQNMAIQDIRNGKGVAIVDPHGEFAEECLKAVPPERINDVIYFNPADQDFPIAMNIMEKVDAEYRHLIASGLVGVFKKLWADSWGPRLEYLLRNAILALLEYPSSTLLGVNRLLIDKEYREKVLEKCTDPVVKSFWTDEFAKYHDRMLTEAISPIQNKVGQFLSSSLIRNIVGQTRSAFNIREVMDKEKILIMNLSKGRIGEDNSALLGAMMITKIQLSAMARVDMPESERKDFYLYVDEFQNFATESFGNILSEARKYRLNLILAHQFIAQLDETVRDAVFGNVGTLVTFRVGAMDAEVLEKEFEPVFYGTDLVNLDKYNVYLKLMIDGVATNPFSATSIEPISLSGTEENAEKVIKVTRERYGSTREEVEDKISRWSGMLNPEVKNKIDQLAAQQFSTKPSGDVKSQRPSSVQPSNQTSPPQNHKPVSQNSAVGASGAVATPQPSQAPQVKNEIPDDRPVFKTECSGCSAEIEVPFKPDGVRPVFCKDCLKNYRRKQSKLQEDLQEREGSVQPSGNTQQQTPVQTNQNQTVSPDGGGNLNGNQSENSNQTAGGDSVKDLINKALEQKSD